MLSSSNAVLAILSGWGGEVPGRTLFQKIGYFVFVDTGSDLGYKPHYYGPYSPLIAATLNEQVDFGEVDERRTALPRVFEGHDAAQWFYSYSLTDKGKEAAELHCRWNPEGFKQAVEVVGRIREIGVDYLQLAFAAKIHYILSQKSLPLEYPWVQTMAQELDWQLTAEDIQKGMSVLKAFYSDRDVVAHQPERRELTTAVA